jgi:hypothetical protein
MAEEEQKSTKLTRKQDRLLQAAVAIRESEPTEEEQEFLTLYLTQATLPHRQLIGDENFLNLEKKIGLTIALSLSLAIIWTGSVYFLGHIIPNDTQHELSRWT